MKRITEPYKNNNFYVILSAAKNLIPLLILLLQNIRSFITFRVTVLLMNIRTFFTRAVNKSRSLIPLILLLTFFSTAQAANIVASVDRNEIFLDESFRLNFEADDSVDGEPNFTPLQKDFEILSQSQSTNMSYVNGQYSRKGVWSLDVMAKRSGALTIPSVAFGRDQSPALRIQIKDPATSKKPATQDSDIYIEVEVDQDKTWVQSQIIYSVRLFSRIPMSITDPGNLKTSDSDAIIKQLGNATTYEAFRGGVHYAVYETRYAIFPQHSGTLTIDPMIMEGRINQGRPRTLFDQFLNQGERKRIRSKPINIEVQPKPSAIKSTKWLPAKNVSLTEEWSGDVTALKSGEPVTRTITIRVDGNMAENLPDLTMPEIKDLKQYPDKPLLDNKVTEHGVSSVRQIKVALIPTRSGDFKMPAISLPWFNTKTGRQEIAKLPEKLIRARGDANQAKPVTPEDTAQQSPAETNESINSAATPQHVDATYWPWLSLFLGAGWLITLIALLRKKPQAMTEKIKPVKTALPPLEKTVQLYCSQNDAAQCKNALLAWAKARWPEYSINSLADISKYTSAELATEIETLNTALYAADASQWRGGALLETFKAFKKIKANTVKSEASPLEPLYKA